MKTLLLLPDSHGSLVCFLGLNGGSLFGFPDLLLVHGFLLQREYSLLASAPELAGHLICPRVERSLGGRRGLRCEKATGRG